MTVNLALMVSTLASLLVILIIIWVVVRWILPPYHPLRESLDRIVEPMLAPIRRFMPATGMIDLSPMILIILIQLLSWVLVSLLNSMR